MSIGELRLHFVPRPGEQANGCGFLLSSAHCNAIKKIRPKVRYLALFRDLTVLLAH